MTNNTEETLMLIFVHDLLVNMEVTEPMSYIQLRAKLQTDQEFVNWLRAYHNIMTIGQKASNNIK